MHSLIDMYNYKISIFSNVTVHQTLLLKNSNFLGGKLRYNLRGSERSSLTNQTTIIINKTCPGYYLKFAD